MLYCRNLTQEERTQIHRMIRRKRGLMGQRAYIILLSSRQISVSKIASIFEVSPATVRHWIHRFNAEGVAGLRTKSRR